MGQSPAKKAGLMELLKLYGIVEEIVYQNEETGFGVIAFDNAGDLINVTGNLAYIVEGESICVNGRWASHPKFGEQFYCEYYEPHFERNVASIYKYLSSRVIKGVGARIAKRIVDQFGEETLNIIEVYPERLSEISGISMQKAMDIHKEHIKKIEIQTVVTFFAKYGISPTLAIRVFNTLGGMTIKLCSQSPYIICEQVDNIGFLTADKIASEMGFPKNSDQRMKSGILYELSRQSMNGHTCYPKDELISEASKTLTIGVDSLKNALDALIFERKLGTYESFVFLPQFYNAETYIANRLTVLNTRECKDLSGKVKISEITDIELSPEQLEAVNEALKSNLLIITGGPGTGKTTVINSLIRAYQLLEKKILLSAPTGRAAKRISELTSCPAKTIHRLLGIEHKKGEKPSFVKNEADPLTCDILIVDEMSMTDSMLFEALLRAVKEGTRLIMVGDCDQLPPVGAGNVLKDMMSCDSIKKISFKKIFRQNDTSKIVENAHRILNGEEPVYNTKDTDFFFMQSASGEQATESVKELLLTRLPDFLKIDPARIQVLTPMRKTLLGSVALNNSIKSVLNPIRDKQVQKQANGYTFTKFDRVMQTKNDYEIEWETKDGAIGEGIFNGDMGIITDIDLENAEMIILFDDEKIVHYDFIKLENLELAYAITVHKSQGSEFDAVVIPLVYGYSRLMTKNLLYTAVTRAKSFVCIVGKKSCVTDMIGNDIEMLRYTGLAHFLKG